MKRITVTLTEDQVSELRELVRWKRVIMARDHLQTDKFDQPSPAVAYIKRIETILAKALAKS